MKPWGVFWPPPTHRPTSLTISTAKWEERKGRRTGSAMLLPTVSRSSLPPFAPFYLDTVYQTLTSLYFFPPPPRLIVERLVFCGELKTNTLENWQFPILELVLNRIHRPLCNKRLHTRVRYQSPQLHPWLETRAQHHIISEARLKTKKARHLDVLTVLGQIL